MVQDASGNVYIVGATPVTGHGYDMDVIKVNSSLGIAWERTYNGAGSLDDIGKGIAVDGSGNVFVTGYTTTSTHGKDIVTIKYNSSGTQQWVNTFDDANHGNDEGDEMAIDASGNIYVTGYITTANDKADYYTIKYNGSGTEIWNIHNDGAAHLNDKAVNIAIDNNGDIVVTGTSETAPNTYQYCTVKYVEKSVITPSDYYGESPQNSFSYYLNSGQIKNTGDSLESTIKYSTQMSSPEFYIKKNSNSFVFARGDTTVSTLDTLQRIDLTFDKVNSSAKTYSLEEQSDFFNYYLPQCPKGITEVHGNKRLITTNLYSNIDLMYSSNQKGIKYYFIVKPGASPADIAFIFTGASSFNLNGSTNALTINSNIGSITYERPTMYQLETNNHVDTITGWTPAWQTNGASNKYKFYVGSYNTSKTLIIEIDRGKNVSQPTSQQNLMHSTYYGGSLSDNFNDVTTSATGSVYIAGFSMSTNFPTVSGSLTPSNNNPDAIVKKYNNGMTPNWGLYYGGGHTTDTGSQGDDEANSIVADNLGHVYFGGITFSSNLHWVNPGGGAYIDSTLSGTGTYKKDMFIVKLDTVNGTPIWATYLGGSTDTYSEKLTDMAVDNNGNLYVVGQREGNTPLKTKSGATNDTVGRGYIAKFNVNDSLVWATAFGGNGGTEEIRSVAVDVNNNLLVTGITNSTTFHTANPGGGAYCYTSKRGNFDAFIAKFDANNLLYWSTFFGGDENEEGDGITSDNSGNIYVTGMSRSNTNFPFLNAYTGMGSYHGPYTFPTATYGDVMVCKFNSSGVQQVSGLYGSTNGEVGLNITVDANNRVFVTGTTVSKYFPCLNSSQSTIWWQNALSNSDNGNEDAILIAFNSSLVPLWATFYGGGNGIYGADWGTSVATFQNKLYMVGVTNSISATIPLVNMGGGMYYQITLGNAPLSLNDGFFAYFNLSPLPIGIDELNISDNNILIYPNPVIDNQNLSICIDVKNKTDINLAIFDITGKCIMKKTYSGLFGKQILSVNMDNYAKGMYIVKLFDNSSVIAKKIVKQ
jgi:hypothetical protein